MERKKGKLLAAAAVAKRMIQQAPVLLSPSNSLILLHTPLQPKASIDSWNVSWYITYHLYDGVLFQESLLCDRVERKTGVTCNVTMCTAWSCLNFETSVSILSIEFSNESKLVIRESTPPRFCKQKTRIAALNYSLRWRATLKRQAIEKSAKVDARNKLTCSFFLLSRTT